MLLDHYLCYGASGPGLDMGVTIVDQFQQQTALLLDPFLFCNPADKNGSGIQNLDDHLACYRYTPPGLGANEVSIFNQFFPNGDVLTVAESFALCLPSKKSIPPPPGLDHFTVYDAIGPDGPVVQIVDQWETQVTSLGPVNRFLVPADKNSEGINDPISHLTCNVIPDDGTAGGAPPTVWAINQFGQQRF